MIRVTLGCNHGYNISKEPTIAPLTSKHSFFNTKQLDSSASARHKTKIMSDLKSKAAAACKSLFNFYDTIEKETVELIDLYPKEQRDNPLYNAISYNQVTAMTNIQIKTWDSAFYFQILEEQVTKGKIQAEDSNHVRNGGWLKPLPQHMEKKHDEIEVLQESLLYPVELRIKHRLEGQEHKPKEVVEAVLAYIDSRER